MDQYMGALAALAIQGSAIFNELETFGEFHVGITLNAVPRSNATAVSLPQSPNPDEPYDCQDIGALIRPNTESCDEILNGLAYVTNEVSGVIGLALQCLLTATGNDGPDSEQAQTVQTIVQSISPTNGEVSACNDGFRDPNHAFLTVVVTDSDEPNPVPELTGLGFRNTVGRGPGQLGMAVLARSSDDCDAASTPCDAEPACNFSMFVDSALRPEDPEAVNVDICDALSDAPGTVETTVNQVIELLPQICPGL